MAFTDVWYDNIPRIRGRCTTLCDQVSQWLATGRWFFPGPPVSSTNKSHHHDIYNWNIVESGAKHHQANKTNMIYPEKTVSLFSVFCSMFYLHLNHVGFCVPEDCFKLFVFPFFLFERTWWRLFQGLCTKLDIYVFITITGSIPLQADC